MQERTSKLSYTSAQVLCLARQGKFSNYVYSLAVRCILTTPDIFMCLTKMGLLIGGLHTAVITLLPRQRIFSC